MLNQKKKTGEKTPNILRPTHNKRLPGYFAEAKIPKSKNIFQSQLHRLPNPQENLFGFVFRRFCAVK